MPKRQNEIHFQFIGIMKLSAMGTISVLAATSIILFFLAIWAFK